MYWLSALTRGKCSVTSNLEEAMASEDSEKLLQEAEERLRKKRAILSELRRTESLGEVVASVASEVATAAEAEKPKAARKPRRTS